MGQRSRLVPRTLQEVGMRSEKNVVYKDHNAGDLLIYGELGRPRPDQHPPSAPNPLPVFGSAEEPLG